MATFFTSDIHFGDQRIMHLCGRAFTSVKKMDKYIVDNWNKKVSNNDIVWVLGDIVSPEHFDKELLNSLNGDVRLVLGNHDYPARDKIAGETKIKIYAEDAIYQEGNIVMCHYPIMDWNGREKGTVHLYGHVHNKNIAGMKEYFADKLAFNVCMDVNDFEPKTLEELIESEGKKDLFEKRRRVN